MGWKVMLPLAYLLTLPLLADVQKRPRTLKILVAGDVMFNWGLRGNQAKTRIFAPVEGLIPLFLEADLRMVNLETPIANSRKKKWMNPNLMFFNAKPEDISSSEKSI
ncbi:MAG: CapA family protein [Leptospiraceae bacterium]|nr:CapA family protein [Leptospiraceae bacterium]